MERILNKISNNKKASIGIGAMIVFIAMVLVAGIAASVLMQTSTKLEMQALKTGQQTTDEVASGVRLDTIEGYNSSGKITKLAIELSARAGSPDIDLSEVVVEISDSASKYVLAYPTSGTDRFTDNSDVNGSVFGCTFPSSSSEFYVIVLQDADDSLSAENPIVNFGDHVILALDTDTPFSGIDPRTDVFGMVIAEEGAPGIIGFTTPPSYTDPVLELQ